MMRDLALEFARFLAPSYTHATPERPERKSRMSDKTEHPPLPEAFAALGVRNSILRGLAEAGFTTPSEIQSLLIPRALAGVDLLGQARTGTGKTAAFGIPVLQVATKGVPTQCLIMVPTRELCVQVDEEIRRLGKFTPIRCTAVYGGQRITAQLKHLEKNPEIVVGTPGRVIDLLDRGLLYLDNIRFVVLDEVDRMLDIGFREDIRNILSRVRSIRRRVQETDESAVDDGQSAVEEMKAPDADTYDNHAPEDSAADHRPLTVDRLAQTIFVSATISDEIEKLSRRYMRDPEKLIAPGADETPTVANVEQAYFSVQPWDKYRLLRAVFQRDQPELVIVFCRTKHGAEKLAKNLMHDGIDCKEIHGNLAQNKRDSVMKSFRGGKFHVLVATDLASRGIDVAGVSHIVNYDIPEDPEIYVHRIGRTARMGSHGKAYTFVTKEQGWELDKVEAMINMVIKNDSIEGFEHRPEPNPRGPVSSLPPEMQQMPDLPKGPSLADQKKPLKLGAKMPVSRRRRR